MLYSIALELYWVVRIIYSGGRVLVRTMFCMVCAGIVVWMVMFLANCCCCSRHRKKSSATTTWAVVVITDSRHPAHTHLCLLFSILSPTVSRRLGHMSPRKQSGSGHQWLRIQINITQIRLQDFTKFESGSYQDLKTCKKTQFLVCSSLQP